MTRHDEPVRSRGERGFSLVELLVATLVTVVCLVGVAVMILYGTRLGASARDASVTSSLAKARLERLRVLPRTAAERQAGGSLTSDVAGHFERQGRFTSRWVVAAGPAGTQDVTVLVIAPLNASVPPSRVRVLVR